MRIGMLQKTMWTLFRPTFQKNLSLLGVKDGRTLMSHAKKRYEQILKDIPEYGGNDVLLVNLLSAAMYASVPGTTVHCFFAAKMGEKYLDGYKHYFKAPDIRHHDLQHEELLICHPEQWVQEVRLCCGEIEI